MGKENSGNIPSCGCGGAEIRKAENNSGCCGEEQTKKQESGGSCCGSGQTQAKKAQKGASCCGGVTVASGNYVKSSRYSIGEIKKPARNIPIVSTELSRADRLGSWKARWAIGRMDYAVEPGLYGVGKPDPGSPVLVSANYKMSFDRLRKELSGIDAWIMVIDTKGINVWCAAGKGTFGTDEIVNRVELTGLKDVVTHRNLILPQLGAPGVAAHEVAKRSGFKVIYGPVRACDIPAFLKAGMEATEEMRNVHFDFRDRIVLTPAEFSFILKPVLVVAAVFIILSLLGVKANLLGSILPYIGAILVGNFVVPALLPWIPGRAFSFKGGVMGLILAALAILLTPNAGWRVMLIYVLILPALSAFVAMNFTGSSTYTSLSGVIKEMRIAIPAIVVSISAGIILGLLKLFVNF